MSHRTIIINSVIIPSSSTSALSEVAAPVMSAQISYTPPDDMSPQDIGKTVARVLKRLPALADSNED